MDLSKIEYFLKAAELENFTTAAQSCNIAQTTMSKYIHTLEEEIGCALFIREKKRVVLTPQGKKFYEGMQSIRQSYRQLLNDLQPSLERGIRLGIALQDYLEFPILQKFEKNFPRIPIYFSFKGKEELLSELEGGKVDALLIPDALMLPEGYDHVPILQMRQSLVCSKAAVERYATIGEIISHLPFITKSDNPGYHTHCQTLFRQLFGVESPEIKLCSVLNEQLLHVGMSRGFAILPYSPGTAFEGLSVLPLGDDFRETTQLVLSGRRQSPALHKLLTFIHEEKC